MQTNIGDYFREVCQRYAASVAFEHMKVALTYQDALELSLAFAAFLQSKGLKKADKVAIMLPNCLPYPVVMMGVFLAGGIVVNINPEFTERELDATLAHAEVTWVIVLDVFAYKLTNRQTKAIVVSLFDLFPSAKRWFLSFLLQFVLRKIKRFKLADSVRFRAALSEGRALSHSSVNICLDDIAFLQFTGGTTGKPKAAMLSHGNILANIRQIHQRFGASFVPGAEVNLLALPLYHIFSLMVNFLFPMDIGCKNIVIVNPRDLTALIKALKGCSLSLFVGVNTLFAKLLHHPLIKQVDFSRLKYSIAGGMALQKQVSDEWARLTGKPILEGYGLTETSPAVTMNALENGVYNGSIGLPLPETELAFLDEQQRPVPQGEVGELAIRGPQVMLGYWKNPEETAKVMTKDGFLLTGDMAYQDAQGLVYLKERKKDLIIVSGFNVYPSELEAILVAHPRIQEAAVIGVLQPIGSEKVVAYVVKKGELTQQAVLDYCSDNLAKYKHPKEVIFVNDLPKSNVGKVLKRVLRERYKHEEAV